MKLETRLNQMLPDWPSFNIQFYELTNHGEVWSVNDSWVAKKNSDKEDTISLLRDRWKIFKLNYLPKARISDIKDIGEVLLINDYGNASLYWQGKRKLKEIWAIV